MTEQEIYEKQELDSNKMFDQQKKYEKFQMKNLGGFTKIFPIETWPSDDNYEEMVRKRDTYEDVREVARDLFNNQFGVRKSNKQPMNGGSTPM